MHVLESYALQNNLKIDKAEVYERFFPLAVDKYITIDTSSLKTPAMSYSHWQIVIDLIKDKLKKLNISIIQLGEKECKPLTDCYLAIGQCNFNQKAYVIKNSIAHISTNNETCHLASVYNKKSVVLFPNNCYPEQFLPYWTSEESLDVLVPESDDKPSFNPAENPKSIDKIRPEDVASKILKFAGVHTFVPEYKTLKIGSSFYRPRIESALSSLVGVTKLGVNSLIVRMDLNFNESNLIKQLEATPCSIITNKAIDEKIIEKYHSKIVEMVYYLTDDHDLNFVKKIKSKSINYILRTRAKGEAYNDLKLSYFDYGIINQIKEKSKDDFEELKNKNKLYYKSKQFIIHNNSFYPCSAALVRGKQGSRSMEHDIAEAIDDPLFWEEEEHFHFFEKK